uniref:Dynamin-type G domain-containing protein n=1 Tax=Chromera velia CCMP2878 TaxID=1169474 RepID=A0A0G4HVE0_9ALVE|eukprot:Cvel_32221.t1-p1 / transcript=Cvel_32221.t1 / gene=Cvel_32221 / organism=Chromera_velia_CCMP2878 / gene_product=Interferon-induced GTP-binding protein Mx, putative / transcript_product=Interferon-induced GTP-binding protein Mx, putative / location=Cvel_scaffold4966:2556-3635(+) / protein_length=360 / sequence_SO=supercontig / SO=protein_coding / is_pseudo=false
MRSEGPSSRVSNVPQFVVVGLQSTGKSSVLQRISCIRLPRDAELCTRVPVELRIRRSDSTELKVKVGETDFVSTDSEAVEKAIRNLQDRLRGDKEISDQSVVVEIESKAHPNVTLIDLPGYFFPLHASNLEETARQKLVASLINSRISQNSALILHATPLNQDAATINTWAIVNAADPQKKRTLTVLTKADEVETQDVFLRRLQHITKDDKPGTRYFIVDGRVEKDENQTLANMRGWLSGSPLAHRVNVGLRALEEDLQNALLDHTLLCLPTLKASLLLERSACRERLGEIGEEPPRPNEALTGGLAAFPPKLEALFVAHSRAIVKEIEQMDTHKDCQGHSVSVCWTARAGWTTKSGSQR